MSDCPICRSSAQPWLTVPCDWMRPHLPHTYQLKRCDACGYGFLWPRPTPEECRNFYDMQDYYTHRPSRDEEPHPSLPARIRKHLAWRLDHSQRMSVDYFRPRLPNAATRVCDIGCGNGDLAAQLRDLGHEVTGVEIDPAARHVAESRGLCVFAGTAEQMPAELFDEPFDVVIMSHVLEHCIDPRAALRNARRVMHDRGLLFCEVPNNACLAARCLGLAWAYLDVPRHLNFFTPQSLAAMARQCGFDVRAVEYTGCNRQFFDERLRSEQHLHDIFRRAGANGQLPSRPSAFSAWMMLARLALADEPQRYDSVRIIASPVVGAGASTQQTVETSAPRVVAMAMS